MKGGLFLKATSILSVCFATLAQSQSPLTPQTLADLKQVGKPVASPDNQQVVFPLSQFQSAQNQTYSNLQVHSLATNQPMNLTEWNNYTSSASPAWLDQQTVAFVHNANITDPQSGTGLYTVATQGGGENNQDSASPQPLTNVTAEFSNLKYNNATNQLFFLASTYPNKTLSESYELDQRQALAGSSAVAYDQLPGDATPEAGDQKHQAIFALPVSKNGDSFEATGEATNLFQSYTGAGFNAVDYAVSSDGVLVAFVAEAAGPNGTVTNMYAVPANGTETPFALTNNTEGQVTNPVFSEDGQKLAWLESSTPDYQAGRNQIVLCGLANNNKTEVASDWELSPTKLAFSGGSESLYAVAQDAGNQKLFLITPGGSNSTSGGGAGGSGSSSMSESSATETETPTAGGAGGEEGTPSSSEETSPTNSQESSDGEGGSPTAAGDIATPPPTGQDNDGLGLSNRRRNYRRGFSMEEERDWYIYAIRSLHPKAGEGEGEDGTPQELTQNGTVTDMASVGNNTVLVTMSSIAKPPELYAVRTPEGEITQVSQLNSEALQDVMLSEPEPFTFQGSNGQDIHGWVVRPSNFDDSTNYPVALLIHDGPRDAWTDQWNNIWNPNAFAGAGYGVIMINPTGSTGYSEQLVNGVQNQWAGAPYDDLMKGLEQVGQNYTWLDTSRTCALGAGYGGYLVNWINGHNSDFSCLVSHAGVFDPSSAYYTTDNPAAIAYDFGGPPFQNSSRDTYDQWNPARTVDQWKTPTLVTQGGNDTRINPAQSLSTFTALQSANVTSRYVLFPDEGHVIQKPGNVLRWHQEVFSWMNQYTSENGTSTEGGNGAAGGGGSGSGGEESSSSEASSTETDSSATESASSSA
ncbi:dipeptidylpeptidase [Dimargaris verticillata]|uniref:Dipeptidyl-peptidase V n=1 Tax=Dimargaris verticillata TaxID=2761393 RepID=A0A9W8EFF2_9FUNG|nr:dipeptidylpeptidase [Dimargaris verticillata]